MKTKLILAAMALTAATTFTTTAQAQLTAQEKAWAVGMCQEASELAGTTMYQWQRTGDISKLKRDYFNVVAGDKVRIEVAFVIFNGVVKNPRARSEAERVGVTRQYMRDFLLGCLAELS